MTPWACGIEGCGRGFESPEGLIRHQTTDHPSVECKVCGETVPAGYLAIRHTFEEHTRAEYVRAYSADSDDIRDREELIELVEETVDVGDLIGKLEANGAPAPSVGD